MNQEWRFRAACIGEDPDIFHRISKDDPGYEEMTVYERKKVEIANFKKAMEICSGCSVRAECRTEGGREFIVDGTVIGSADVFSVWGGEPPTGYSFTSVGRPRKGADESMVNRVCRNGHKGDFRREGSGYKCRTCIRLRRSGELEEKPRPTVADIHALADHDHDFEPVIRQDRTKCRICEVRRNTEWRRSKGIGLAKQSVDYDARHETRQGHAPDWRPRRGGRWCAICEKQRQQRRRKTVDTGA